MENVRGDIVHVVEGKPPLMGNLQPSGGGAKMGQRNGGGPVTTPSFSSPTSPTSGGGGLDTRIVNNGPLSRKTTVVRPPMPSEQELERRFNEVLIQMDLPPERAKILKGFTNEKKWDTVCDHDLVHAKDPPEVYLAKLRSYLDPAAAKASSRKLRHNLGDATSTQVLRDLEISLRTNHIEWVREFLSEESRGLDILIEYLSSRLLVMRQKLELDLEEEAASAYYSDGGSLAAVSDSSASTKRLNLSIRSSGRKSSDLTRNEFRKSAKRDKHRRIGDVTDDIHVCIMCLRAIMNNKFGFNMVIKHKQAINSIALSLIHKKLRTKALVLELLAAICLLKGGHTIILNAFDNFKQEMRETHRFQTLVSFFTSPQEFQIEFMVACMQFINIVVHSVEDMNFRVALQYEFTHLGLDECLERLRHNESDELAVQISAYVDNEFDVAGLMEEAETRQAALDQVAELEEELARVAERLAETEMEAMSQQVSYENRIEELQRELRLLSEEKEKVRSEYSTLQKNVERQEEEKKKRQSMLEVRIRELEKERDSLKSASNSSLSSSLSGGTPSVNQPSPAAVAAAAGPAPPPPPPPPSLAPPPPPPPMGRLGGPAPPPPPPGMLGPPPAPGSANMTIKRAVKTVHRLPTLQIQALKPNDIKDTAWYTMDDEKIMKEIDFAAFEEAFKLNPVPTNRARDSIDNAVKTPTVKAPQLDSLMEHTRLKNVAICKRRLPNMSTDDLMAHINALDGSVLGLDAIELLQRIVPTPEEVKAYREYVFQKKDLEKLTEEDRFIARLSRVERLSAKLEIMSFMLTFYDLALAIRPRIESIYLAAKSTRNSKKFKKVLEIILAFGNYMNSSKKGAAYGFRLQSLDNLNITKSSDKKSTVVNFIVDVVNSKYPELRGFDLELKYIDKAAQFSLENILTDVAELEKGMSLTQKELQARAAAPPTGASASRSAQNLVLKDFVENAGEQLKKLAADAANAKAAFAECLEHYGEDPKATDTNAFFAVLLRFVNGWKVAETENEKRRKLEKARQLALQQENNNENDLSTSANNISLKNAVNNKKKQAMLISDELRTRNNRKPMINPDEVKDGTLEQMILDIKAEPYRTNDAMRRSVRRTERLMSRPFDEEL